MPEIKNTFLKSKMNKDLDARLLPNGEYRDAQNINVSRPQTQDTPRMIEDDDLVKEELTKLSLYDRPHVRS